jgi:hypothetical protein
MKIIFLLLSLIYFFTSIEAEAKNKLKNDGSEQIIGDHNNESKPFFKDKDLYKPKNVIIDTDFDVTYSLLELEKSCKILLNIKNISKNEKINTFSVDIYTYTGGKIEAFITEKRSKPSEIVTTQILLGNVECDNIRKINFYK